MGMIPKQTLMKLLHRHSDSGREGVGYFAEIIQPEYTYPYSVPKGRTMEQVFLVTIKLEQVIDLAAVIFVGVDNTVPLFPLRYVYSELTQG